MKNFIFVFLIYLVQPLCAQPCCTDTLVVGTASGYAPYVSLNTAGCYEGFDIDVASLLAEKLNKSLVIKDFGTMPCLMLALKQKKVDVLIWAIDITKERLEKMAMIYYHGPKIVEMPLLFWQTIPSNISSLESLAEDPRCVIAVEAGTSQEGIFRSIPGLQLKYKDSIMDVILELKYGKCFTTTVDASILPRLTTLYPEINVLKVPLPKDEQILGHGICVNKDNKELIEQIQTAVDAMIANGDIANLEQKWQLKKDQ
ncbi:MAG: transporter substrate-binding domain-containing protein [Verrucomicrobia bacterium]|nr:transporter substrate-binding domain-containing protein [Verrucomicrobiota bacterium]MBS0646169.1 transporter substrate-binding domain-containing protein [Verrucomicrobiota bacterium]